MQKIVILICLTTLPFVIGEVVVRNLGFVDVPIYKVDGNNGYIALPNQSGNFANTNDWCFNNLSMPICSPYDSSKHPNVLLVGNSVVMGGNPFRQKDKLTSVLQDFLGDKTLLWPVAIGGWTTVNEVNYFDEQLEVGRNADVIAWEYMSGGLSGATPWTSEYFTPTRRPICAICYFVRRYILLRLFRIGDTPLPVIGEVNAIKLANFDTLLSNIMIVGNTFKPGFIWLYPNKTQFMETKTGGNWLPEREQIIVLAKKYRLDVIDIADSPAWKLEFYRDGTHPTIAGTRVLASILAGEIFKLQK